MCDAAADDHYGALGLAPLATEDDIRRAFKRLALQHHPDKAAGGVDAFRRIQEAYAVLSDPARRAEYDRPPTFAFCSAFPARGGDGDERAPRVEVLDVPVTLGEVRRGARKLIDVSIEAACDACDGRGTPDARGVEVCPACMGLGAVMALAGHNFFSEVPCGACGGRGALCRSPCPACAGSCTRETVRRFWVDARPGVRDGEASAPLPGKGPYDRRARRHADVVFRFRHAPEEGMRVLNARGDVGATLGVDVRDVLLGFDRSFKVYSHGERVSLSRAGYSRPDEPFVLPGMGLPPAGDLIVRLRVEYPDALPPGVARHRDVLARLLLGRRKP
jgi:molecular chaperone DnaJ